LASGSSADENSIKIWDFHTGMCLRTLIGHKNTISALIAVNEEILASSSYDFTVKIWKWKIG